MIKRKGAEQRRKNITMIPAERLWEQKVNKNGEGEVEDRDKPFSATPFGNGLYAMQPPEERFVLEKGQSN